MIDATFKKFCLAAIFFYTGTQKTFTYFSTPEAEIGLDTL